MSKGLSRVLERVRGGNTAEIEQLQREVRQLQAAVEESRRLNERLSDVLDVVVELLVPAVDRNEDRLAETLKKL